MPHIPTRVVFFVLGSLVVALAVGATLFPNPPTANVGQGNRGVRSPGDRFPDVEADVRRALPLGLTRDAVARTLDSMGVSHSRPNRDSLRIVALVPAVGARTRFSNDALFELRFDSSGRLTHIDAKRVYKGP
jgi:hypothetical protein